MCKRIVGLLFLLVFMLGMVACASNEVRETSVESVGEESTGAETVVTETEVSETEEVEGRDILNEYKIKFIYFFVFRVIYYNKSNRNLFFNNAVCFNS